MIGLFGDEVIDTNLPSKLSKYQVFKIQHHYRYASEKFVCCGKCENHIRGEYHDKIYHKCDLLGCSHGPATDIRVSKVCDLFKKEVDK